MACFTPMRRNSFFDARRAHRAPWPDGADDTTAPGITSVSSMSGGTFPAMLHRYGRFGVDVSTPSAARAKMTLGGARRGCAARRR